MKWEYYFYTLPKGTWNVEKQMEDVDGGGFEELGEQGWELVAIFGRQFVFKRQIIPVI